MTGIVLSWLVLAVAVWLTAKILPGFEVKSFGAAIGVAAIFGLLNWLVGWALFVAIGLGTLGLGFVLAFLTRWFVNAILLKVTDAISDSLSIKSFGTAFVGGLLMSGLGTAGQWLIHGMV
jgi:putative membrane protein